ncbi:TonB-dependent receptor [Sandaracinobacteroides saxicola]|uniref:TonB-dependent receptor n=1 Tax=Sandaracinobacteroides saxicola TaxID=2759707 RepID=A0A7G5IEH5_9SPHN|nr:TonB-dependent receptor [Sandaracinobacteroides saxicola]QMW21767.1 TonB-dependent receptor [Sandaracinobacteroides saxicola]
MHHPAREYPVGRLLLAGLLATTTAPLLAQTAAAPALEDIVVTAQKRAQAVQDVPIAVSALDQVTLERLNARDIRDITGAVPNLVLTEVSIGPSMSQISLRGVNSQDPEKSFDPAVGVFIDGVYLGTSAFNLLDSFDLERVEVLRGPQGTLFGRNTTGGAINAFRTRPTGEFGIRLRGTLGSHDRRDLTGVLNIPIGNIVSAKLSGFILKDDGVYANGAGGATGAKDRWGVSGTVMVKADRGELIVTYDHQKDDSQLVPYIPRNITTLDPLPALRITQTVFPVPATITPGFGPDLLCLRGGRCDNPNDRRSFATDAHFQKSSLDALTVQGNLDLTDSLRLETVFGWRQSKEKVYIDFDGTERTVFNVYRGQDYHQLSGEARLAYNAGDALSLVGGVFYFESQYRLEQAIKLDLAMTGAPLPLGLLYANGSGDEDRHSARTVALFGQADWKLADTLTLSLGARVNWDHKTIDTAFFGAARAPGAPYSVLEGAIPTRPLTSSGGASKGWTQFTPRVILNWKPTPDLLLYVSYSRGYNAGGFSARAGTVPDVTTPFNPETINAYEAGVKSDWLDGRLRLNAAAFWNDYRDKQEEAIEPGPPPTFTSTTVRNVARARLRGLEFELSALPVDMFRLDASLGLLDAKYTRYSGFLGSGQYVSVPGQPAGTLIAADLSNLRLRRAPKVTASIIPTFTADLGEATFSINGQARYASSQYVEFFNSARGLIPATWTFDASAQIGFGGPKNDRYRVTVFGKNLSDRVNIASFTNSLVDFSTVSAPRTWGVELQLRY